MTTPVTAPLSGTQLQEMMLARQKGTLDLVIDVDNSPLKGDKLLTYLTNLGLPCRFHFESTHEYLELLWVYCQARVLHDCEQLKEGSMAMCLQALGYVSPDGVDYQPLFDKDGAVKLLQKWTSILASMLVYNLQWAKPEFDPEFLKTQYPVDDTTDVSGLNLVHLCQHEDLTLILMATPQEALKYYTHFFDQPIFRGQPLAYYWCTQNNAVFTMTLAQTNPQARQLLEDTFVSVQNRLTKEISSETSN